MSRTFTFTALALALGLVAACSRQADPMSANDAGLTRVNTTADAGRGVVNHVSMGRVNTCEILGNLPDCGASFSLMANLRADGSATGRWQETFDDGIGSIDVAVDCLKVEGNGAVIGGVVTHGSIHGQDMSGRTALTAVVDNGPSAHDPPDQIGFSFLVTTGQSCLPLSPFTFQQHNLPRGQVTVR